MTCRVGKLKVRSFKKDETESKTSGKIEKEIRSATTKHNTFLTELGLPPLP
jgi:hypothetical protein